MLFICVQTVWSQENLTFHQYEDFQYIMKVDVNNNTVKPTLDNELLPWLPKNFFGWQVKDNNHLGLFFQSPPNAGRIDLNFFDQIVLAFVKYDRKAWDFAIESVDFNAQNNVLTLIYQEKPLDGNLAFAQTSCKLVAIDQGRGIEKIGVRNVKFEVLRRSASNPNQLIPLEDDLIAFPVTHTAEQYLSQYEKKTNKLEDLVHDGTSGSAKIASAEPQKEEISGDPIGRGDAKMVNTSNPDLEKLQNQLENFQQSEASIREKREKFRKEIQEAELNYNKVKAMQETLEIEKDEINGKIQSTKSELKDYQSDQDALLAKQIEIKEKLKAAEELMDSALQLESATIKEEQELKRQKEKAENKINEMQLGSSSKLTEEEAAAKKQLEEAEARKQEMLRQKREQYMKKYSEERKEVLNKKAISPDNFSARDIGNNPGVAETRVDNNPKVMNSSNLANLEEEKGTSLRYMKINGYKIRDRHNFEGDSFMILRNKIEFEMYMEKLPEHGATPILNGDFVKYFAVLVVKSGKKKFDFRTQKVRYDEETNELSLSYSSKVSIDNLKEEVFTPYLILIDKKNTNKIKIIENGRKIYDLPTRR